MFSQQVSRTSASSGFPSAVISNLGQRGCTPKMGNGSCIDAKRNRYNYCFSPANTYSLEACQSIAENNKDIAGIQYVRGEHDAYCLLLLDESALSGKHNIDASCPDQFTYHRESDWSGGHGPVAGIDSVGECYSCTDDYCTELIGPGECVDVNHNRFNYCFATAYTLQQCQLIAAKNKQQFIGIEYGLFEDTSYCFLLMEALTTEGVDIGRLCPPDFITDEASGSNQGKGLIHDAVAMKGYECYACTVDIGAVVGNTAVINNNEDLSSE
ncbi:hypothetical protein FisN_3Lh054 [Fistulifera solaris]|uniref:Uncharacterized protein n=1 Tax=Fistulifera solaris TaxID=1519565 RepID=A0A1Z5JZ42_FISSO|nr:hypothetical protein FisN_3Lh054 [Fistulifera solaris]|eukprot:GAX19116.1 hypothetical protein FisN_3Lh054 [Fistulifera solaris]